jgi:TonB family protein
MKNRILVIALALISYSGYSQTEEPVLTFVHEMPTYPGGEEALYNFLYQGITYPEVEKSMNIEGTVFVNFVVEKDGTPTHFKITKGIEGGAGLDSVAINACRALGKFNPGTQDGFPQRVYLTIPVKFTLEDDAPVAELQLTAKELKEIEKDAKDLCKMFYDIVELQLAGDTVKVNALRKTYEPKMAELQKKYSMGSVFEKKLEEFVKPCMDEAMKRFPNEQSEVQEEIKLSNREIKRIKKDGKYICDMVFKLVEAQKSNDQSKVEKLTAEFDKKAAALKKKYPEGSAKEDRLEDIVKPCLEEAMKAAMGN